MTEKTLTPTPNLATLHNKAVKLAGVLNAIAHLENLQECREGQSALIFVAEELGQHLARALAQATTAQL